MAGSYDQIVERIFHAGYTPGAICVPFMREEIPAAAKALELNAPKNLGDVPYAYRYRRPLPASIRATCPDGMEWVIRGQRDARDAYEFVLVPITEIVPSTDIDVVLLPDATPEIVRRYALSDEQALLAVLRYNRLLDIFTGVATYSLQNHLRTTIGRQQIEVDELYVGVGRTGEHYVFPVQAKGGRDKLGRIQLEQDLQLCAEKYPHLICRAIAAQFMSGEVIVLFELDVDDTDVVRVVDERHYQLVPATAITDDVLRQRRDAHQS